MLRCTHIAHTAPGHLWHAGNNQWGACSFWFLGTHLKASQKAALPTLGLPKLMHRTSAVGHCSAIQTAATVAMAPAPQ